MAQPMGRCLPEALRRMLAGFAARCEMVNCILKDLLHNQVHATARHWPMQATDRQQQRRRLVRVGQHRQIVVLAVASQLRHQLRGRWQQALLVALAGDREPPALLAVAIAPLEEPAHWVAHDFGNSQPHQIQQ
ncbi:hypothetical protein AWB68_08972 [Caballeronia choica]|uniref:Uncharacterized protein n=1 Tax=Caballeronia choica TaxID=326476 RepID=A0A158L7C2_9BURK|nr:hypothetical protein AWB68_08972 [Caballeronia choica]